MELSPIPGTSTIDEIFAEDRSNPPAERCLPWIESRDGITVVVEPRPHWAEDLRVFASIAGNGATMPIGWSMVGGPDSMAISTPAAMM